MCGKLLNGIECDFRSPSLGHYYDHYVIVINHENVQRKMQVTLPEDYSEKLTQKNGTKESHLDFPEVRIINLELAMNFVVLLVGNVALKQVVASHRTLRMEQRNLSDLDFPEVKDYKPRKQLGDEVIEQEVYGIDPYTHNLLLDSIPEESDWHLLDKHYPLKPVVEDILKKDKVDYDTRTLELCKHMLKSMSRRPDDNYVAYRKGLGVVCNKEAGFSEDDFVVEFLGEVYPALRWFQKQDGVRALRK
ncbi:hypothetical protein Tco_0110530 [Tanacetum coccineum]